MFIINYIKYINNTFNLLKILNLKIMRKKKDNNLIFITIGDRKFYYTSMNRASYKLGIAPASIKWYLEHKNSLKTENNEDVTIKLIDGSEIPYKYINNY